MAIYLDERLMGYDDQLIGFPHILVCLGFVALIEKSGNKCMAGFHLTAGTENCKKEFSIFADEITQHVESHEIKKIYGSCNFNEHYKEHNNKVAAWEDEMTYFGRLLGFQGKAYGFDTSVIKPRDGTYIQYELDTLTERCKIFYRQDDRMKFDKKPQNAPEGKQAVLATPRDIPENLSQRAKEHFIKLQSDHTEVVKLSTAGILKIKKGKGLFAKGILREAEEQRIREITIR